MDMKIIGKWSYLVGLLVAIVAALFSFTAEWLSLILVVLAVLTGLFYADTKELTNYGVRYLTLAAVYAVFMTVPYIGEYITFIAGGMLAYFGPIIMTVLFVFTFKQAFDLIKSK
jgi:uncharacterized membrane protein